MSAILDISIVGGPLLYVLYGVTAAVLIALSVRRYRSPLVVASLTAVLGGAAVGWMISWLVSDVWDLFGVSLSTTTRLWATGCCAALALVGVIIVAGTRWRRIVAIVAVPLLLLSAAGGVNADFGQFTTVRTALGLPTYDSLAAATASSPDSVTGVVGTVTIPATTSGFPARSALVYLPPAARRANPPDLPVVEMLSGQPGSPADVFTAGHLATILDSYAAGQGGVAPIVVVPDQLGAPDLNPMCVDSDLGNSASYLTVDVPKWIRSHLHVAAGPDSWAIAGFSQGGTCSIQLGAAHPEIYGTVLDISGELAPQNGSVPHTITAGFAGDAAAYAAAAPVAVLGTHAPYANLTVIVAVGGDDTRYLPWAQAVVAAAHTAGANTHLLVSPGTAHDWHTVQYAWTQALPLIAVSTGLPGT
ncbi:alpha/beta hydrolase-fold protein [Cryobacterium sp. SO2]|uniref:alpha/beta hydrolase n=1 Tax=Cryobacterium sp. SO2 TaxID=1897060 RepID=UPI00223CE996|nr:alpha/beta hydrolase-fold protein [Cryobacterium sp. SO2]WEO79093.1 alpha/beta hydrolase-fold protein [Cryobacterium sp. SO2]